MSELRVSVTAVLFFAAMVIPFAWNDYDTRRRAELRRVNYVACLSHHGPLECDWARPTVIDSTIIQICELRHDPRACAALAKVGD